MEGRELARTRGGPRHVTVSASFWLGSSRHRLRFCELLALLPIPKRVDQLVQVALEDGREAVQREIDPVVGDPTLRKVLGADPLAPLAGPDLAPAIGSDGRGLFVLGALEQTSPEHPHGLCPILDLRPLVLARHYEPAG